MGRCEQGTYGVVSRLGQAVAVEVESEEVGREVAEKVNAICDRAWRREDCLDAVDSLGYHVRLVLNNEEDTYREVCELTKRHLSAADPCPACEGTNTAGPGLVGQNTECPYCRSTGTVKRHPHQLGEQLREYVEDLAGLEGFSISATVAREVLYTALAWVDWNAIARVYLSEVEESDRTWRTPAPIRREWTPPTQPDTPIS